MACPDTHPEWTFHMINDRTGVDILLLFCLRFERGMVTGTVSDEFGRPLSTDTSVRGITLHDKRPRKDFTTLNFRWDNGTQAIRIFMVGFIFVDDDNVNVFQGRFIAQATGIGLLEVAVESARERSGGPDSGDTGTGNGQQT